MSVGPGLSADGYVELLQARAGAAHRAGPGGPGWARPLLEWMVRDGDELLLSAQARREVFGPPPRAAAPPAVRRLTVDHVRDRLDRNRRRLARAEASLAALTASRGPADAAVVNVPLASRPGTLTDARLDRWRTLHDRVAALRHKVGLDEARLRRAAS